MVNLSMVTSVREGQELVDHARELAERLLAPEKPRWRHTRGVAARAAAATVVVPPHHRASLVAAAWVHDIGYAPSLHRCAFHPLDGAWHLEDLGYDELVVGLVAHHSGARFIAAQLDLTPLLDPFDHPLFTTGPLADALTYADQTTGVAGEAMDVDDRLAEMIARHGPDSPNARCHGARALALRAAVVRTRERLRDPVRSSGPLSSGPATAIGRWSVAP